MSSAKQLAALQLAESHQTQLAGGGASQRAISRLETIAEYPVALLVAICHAEGFGGRLLSLKPHPGGLLSSPEKLWRHLKLVASPRA